MYDYGGNKMQTEGDPQALRIAVFCVGNRLHLDDGIGPAVFDEVKARFDVPDNVLIFDVGVLSMDMISYIDTCDVVIAIDALENSGEPAGTVFRYGPRDLARPANYVMSLHDLKLADLYDAAELLGYDAEGICLGMQVVDSDPEFLTDDLTPPVREALPLLVDALAAELARLGSPFIDRATGRPYVK